MTHPALSCQPHIGCNGLKLGLYGASEAELAVGVPSHFDQVLHGFTVGYKPVGVDPPGLSAVSAGDVAGVRVDFVKLDGTGVIGHFVPFLSLLGEGIAVQPYRYKRLDGPSGAEASEFIVIRARLGGFDMWVVDMLVPITVHSLPVCPARRPHVALTTPYTTS